MVPIDGISNPALINGGVDFWAIGTGDSATTYGCRLDVLYNHRLFSLMSLPVFWEGGLGIGYLRREGRDGWAPSAILGGPGAAALPRFTGSGGTRSARRRRATSWSRAGPDQANGYGSAFLRSSLEVATWILRLQAGPTVDFRTGRLGIVAGLGLEFPGTRWIAGGGSLKDF